MTNKDRTLEAHNRIFHFICLHSNKFSHVSCIENNTTYNEWMENIIKKLNKEYIISENPDYYDMLVDAEIKGRFTSEETFYEAKKRTYEIIKKIYPILNNEIKGHYFCYTSALMDNIINPLLLDQEFTDIVESDYT